MERAQERKLLAESLKIKEAQRRELAKLPIEKKIKLVKQLIDVSRSAGKLPDWYYRLFSE